MKKLLSFAVIAVFIVAFAAGCGSKSTSGDTKAPPAGGSTTTTAMKDGTYKAEYSHLDGKGWKPSITIEVKDGKITKADFDYYNATGARKSKDEAYNKAMKDKAGTNPSEYVVKFNEALVKNQAADKIDAVAGATHSHEFAVALAKAAMEAASKGDTKTAVLPMNETYTATEKDFDKNGYKASVSLTFENNKITKVVFDEADKDGKKKSENADYNTKMKAASKVSAKEAMEKLAATYLSSQKVDTVAGATGTSTKFKTLVEQAAAMRK